MDAGMFAEFHEYLTYDEEPEYFHVSKMNKIVFMLPRKLDDDEISIKLAFNEKGEVELANLKELFFTYDKAGNIVLKFTDDPKNLHNTLTLKKDACISVMLNSETVAIFDSSNFDSIKSAPEEERNNEFYRLFQNEPKFSMMFKYFMSYPIRPETPEPKFIPDYIKSKLSSNFLKSSRITVRRKDSNNG